MMNKKAFAEMFMDGREAYAAGKNVVQVLLSKFPDRKLQAIEISYSLQSGTYTSQMLVDRYRKFRREVTEIIQPLMKSNECTSILDCGVGEGTNWLDFDGKVSSFFGLDASFNRLKYCHANLMGKSALGDVTLIKGNMTSIPLSPDSVDAVVTMHSIEPNNDSDAEIILKQLFSISKKLVILFEPDFRSASPEMRSRMEQHDFAKNIWESTDRITSHKIILEGMISDHPNPLNTTSYRVFKRQTAAENVDNAILCSPINGSALSLVGGALEDADRCFAFPILSEIACLAPEDGIFVGAQLD